MIAENSQTFLTQGQLAQVFSEKLEKALDRVISRQGISEDDALKIQTLVFDAFTNMLDAPAESPAELFADVQIKLP